MSPLQVGGQWILPIAWMAKTLQATMGPALPSLLWLSSLLAFGLGLSRFSSPLSLAGHPLWHLIRAGGVLCLSCMLFDLGPAWLLAPEVKGVVFDELLPLLFCLFLIAGLTLPLLLDYGLVEFVGVFASPLMRPLFKLPGSASIDCLSSWLGDGSLGIMVTARQYHQGHYSEKEAAVIATNFSLVSLTFTLVVVSQLQLEHRFGLFYFLLCVCGLSCALVLPRIPPLSWKSERKIATEEEAGSTSSLFQRARQEAQKRAQSAPGLLALFHSGSRQSSQMIFGLIPVVAMLGSAFLVIAENTPIFDWLGRPFLLPLEWLGLEGAELASRAILVGLADMFLPALIVSSVESEATRLFIGVLSVNQLIYFSEVGAMILATRLPLKLWELVVIFFLRTLVSFGVLALWLLFF